MKGSSIKHKFMAMFVIGSLFVLFVAGIGIYGTVKGKSELESLFNDRETADNTLGHLKEDIRDTRILLLTLLTEKDKAERSSRVDEMTVLDTDIDIDFNQLMDSTLVTKNPDTVKKLEDIISRWGEFRKTRYDELQPLIMGDGEADAKKLAWTVQQERYLRIIGMLDELHLDINNAIEVRHKAVEAKGKAVLTAILLLMGAGCILCAVVFILYSKDIISRIDALKEGAKRVSAGDLSSRVDIKGEDEIASLGAVFNQMADWIQEDMDTMLRSERELQEKNVTLNEAMVELQQHTKVIEFASKERERQNKQLVEMQSQLLQSEKMASVGQLAAGVAHEINNPVGYVNGNISTLSAYIEDIKELNRKYGELLVACREHRCDSVEVKEKEIEQFRDDKDMDFVFDDLSKLLEESREGLDRVTTIVRDLKHFSHVDEAELREFDVNKGLDSTLNVAWNEIKYKAEVERDYGDIPLLLCYPQQLNQVFMNIIVNASHAITGDNVRGFIRIRTYQADRDVFIEISDNGCGIPDDKINKIFEPFFTTKPVGKGTGLGLSMAYSIIRKHKGEISVRSKVGEGTTFIIRLPLDTDEEQKVLEETGRGI